MAAVEVGAEETSGEEGEGAVEEIPGVAAEGVGEEEGTSGEEAGAAGEAAAGASAEHKRMLAFATSRASTSEHIFVVCVVLSRFPSQVEFLSLLQVRKCCASCPDFVGIIFWMP